jgi:hypothetical protein
MQRQCMSLALTLLCILGCQLHMFKKFVLFVTGFKSFVPSVTRNEGNVIELPCQYYWHF